MRRSSLFTFLIAALLLAACATSGTQTPAPTSLVTPAQATQAGSQPSINGCTAESPQPTPGPTETSLFPPISDEDWTQGLKTASVQIIEYSDFQ